MHGCTGCVRRMGIYTSGKIAKPLSAAQIELLQYGSELMRELYPDAPDTVAKADR
jgi:hypothetical protein